MSRSGQQKHEKDSNNNINQQKKTAALTAIQNLGNLSAINSDVFFFNVLRNFELTDTLPLRMVSSSFKNIIDYVFNFSDTLSLLQQHRELFTDKDKLWLSPMFFPNLSNEDYETYIKESSDQLTAKNARNLLCEAVTHCQHFGNIDQLRSELNAKSKILSHKEEFFSEGYLKEAFNSKQAPDAIKQRFPTLFAALPEHKQEQMIENVEQYSRYEKCSLFNVIGFQLVAAIALLVLLAQFVVFVLSAATTIFPESTTTIIGISFLVECLAALVIVPCCAAFYGYCQNRLNTVSKAHPLYNSNFDDHTSDSENTEPTIILEEQEEEVPLLKLK